MESFNGKDSERIVTGNALFNGLGSMFGFGMLAAGMDAMPYISFTIGMSHNYTKVLVIHII